MFFYNFCLAWRNLEVVGLVNWRKSFVFTFLGEIWPSSLFSWNGIQSSFSSSGVNLCSSLLLNREICSLPVRFCCGSPCNVFVWGSGLFINCVILRFSTVSTNFQWLAPNSSCFIWSRLLWLSLISARFKPRFSFHPTYFDYHSIFQVTGFIPAMVVLDGFRFLFSCSTTVIFTFSFINVNLLVGLLLSYVLLGFSNLLGTKLKCFPTHIP